MRARPNGANLSIAARRALPVGTVQEVKRRPTRGDHCGAVGPANVDYHGHIHPVALLLDRAFRPDDVDMPLWLLRRAFGPHRPYAACLQPQPPCPVHLAGAHVRSEGAIRSFWVFLSLSLLVDCVWIYKTSGLNPFTWEQLEQLQRQARAPGGKPARMVAPKPARCGARTGADRSRADGAQHVLQARSHRSQRPAAVRF